MQGLSLSLALPALRSKPNTDGASVGVKKAEAAPSCLWKNTPSGISGGGVAIISKGGGCMSVTFEVKDYKLIKKKINDMQKAPRQVMKSLTSDAKKRVPGWVAAEVTKEYGVKKGEITGQKLGRVTPQGSSFQEVRIVYTGRMLTHTHFNMSPKAPNPGGAYTLKATIVKGQRATLGKVKKLTKKQRAALAKNFTGSGSRSSDHSPIMLMRANGGQYLPFQRVSQDRGDIVVRKAISLPQMVSSKRTEVGIQRAINEGLGKRLDHYMKRYMG